ncbi:hypothetical protein [Chryseobacterium sp. A301]
MRKLKFYLIGLIPGIILVFFILNKKGATCTGYLPNSRVVAETLSKDFFYDPTFTQQMKDQGVTPEFLKDSIITKGEVDFTRSDAQKKPCPQYVIQYPKKNPRYEIAFEKCDEKANFKSLNGL